LHQTVSRTIALEGRYVSLLGAMLIALGSGLPVWSVLHRTQAVAARIEFVGGQLRPAMITLPPMADSTIIAIAESEVTQSQFHHVVGGIPRHIAHAGADSWQTCPTPFNRDTLRKPVACVTPLEAAAYANRLTVLENSARQIKGEEPLTPCYRAASIRRINPNCTGYRLPTVEEWNHAGTGNSPIPVGEGPTDRCRFAHTADCDNGTVGPRPVKDLLPSAWFLYDMFGNVAEIAISESDGEVKAEVLGGSWSEQHKVEAYRKLFIAPTSDTGFRVLRKLSN